MKVQRFGFARAFPVLSLTALFSFVVPAACDVNPEIKLPGGSGGDGQCLEHSERCGFEGCETNDDCNPGRFCNSFGACQRSCESCGAPCDAATPCKAGQYCSVSGTCEQECVPELADPQCGRAPTGETYLCGLDGKCTTIPEPEGPGLGVGGSGNSGSGGGGGEGGGPGCIDQEVEFTPEIPNVVLLIDQSLSMTDEANFGTLVEQEIEAGTYVPWGCPENPEDPLDSPDQEDADWRWNVVRNVLFNPDAGIVRPLEGAVRFGMALYSWDTELLEEEPVPMCPLLTEVELKLDNYQAMLDAMRCSELVVETPTRESLRATAEKLAALDVEGPKFLILATDGEPDNCACPNWDQFMPGAAAECLDSATVERDGTPMTPREAERYDVEQEAKRIFDELGITVHVIDVSTPNNTRLREHLTRVARSGGGEIFDGTRPSGLVDAFETIIDGVRSCVIDLSGEILEGKESEGTVLIDGEEIPLLPDGEGDGWKLNSKSQIELVGAPCELIKSGKHDIDIDFPCDVFIPEPGIN